MNKKLKNNKKNKYNFKLYLFFYFILNELF